MKHEYSIEHGGVALRPLEAGDIEQLRIWRNDGSNSRFMRKIPKITQADQQIWYEMYLQDDTTITLAIDCDGELMGSVSLYNMQQTSIEFGRLMVGGQKGRGIGRSATIAALMLAFDVLAYEKITATVAIENAPALAVYTYAGFCTKDLQRNELSGMDEYAIELEKHRFDLLRPLFSKNGVKG